MIKFRGNKFERYSCNYNKTKYNFIIENDMLIPGIKLTKYSIDVLYKLAIESKNFDRANFKFYMKVISNFINTNDIVTVHLKLKPVQGIISKLFLHNIPYSNLDLECTVINGLPAQFLYKNNNVELINFINAHELIWTIIERIMPKITIKNIEEIVKILINYRKNLKLTMKSKGYQVTKIDTSSKAITRSPVNDSRFSITESSK